jgi:hypothetical protein
MQAFTITTVALFGQHLAERENEMLHARSACEEIVESARDSINEAYYLLSAREKEIVIALGIDW